MGFRLETGLGGAEAGGAAKTLTRRLGGQPAEKAEELRRRRARRERGRPLPHWCSSAPGSPQTPRPMRAPSLQGPLRPASLRAEAPPNPHHQPPLPRRRRRPSRRPRPPPWASRALRRACPSPSRLLGPRSDSERPRTTHALGPTPTRARAHLTRRAPRLTERLALGLRARTAAHASCRICACALPGCGSGRVEIQAARRWCRWGRSRPRLDRE